MPEPLAVEIDAVPTPIEPPRPAQPLPARTLFGLFLGAFVVFVIGVQHPRAYIYDEVYHAYTAGEYVRGNRDAYVWNTTAPRKGVAYMWNHPPAAVHLIGLGIRLWGDRSFGWRFMSTVFGGIGIALLFVLARALTRDTLVAFLAAGVLMLDGLYYVQSRTAMLDVFGVVFMLTAFLALVEYLNRPPERGTPSLIVMGIAMGLAVATKWNAAYASALIVLVVVGRSIAARVPIGRALLLPLTLVLLPALVYLAAYVPFFATGHTFDQFIELQRQIYSYHAGLKATHNYQSAWWQWPLALRPVWYYVAYHETTIENIYANVNPLLAWGFLPAVIWVVARWWRERRAAAVVLLIGFFGQWLPWALIPRIAFAYHFLPSVTFGCVAVAATCATGIRKGGLPRALALTYLVLIAAAFVFFLPIYSGLPLAHKDFAARIWIRSWR